MGPMIGFRRELPVDVTGSSATMEAVAERSSSDRSKAYATVRVHHGANIQAIDFCVGYDDLNALRTWLDGVERVLS